MTAPIPAPVVERGLAALHPDCTDWRGLGPTESDAAIRAMGAAVTADAEQRGSQWSQGFSRRRLLKGGLGVGVAALASQLVTTRVSYAESGGTNGTMIVVFLRGGMDGLSVLVPATEADMAVLRVKRPGLLTDTIDFKGRSDFRLHSSMKGLSALIANNQLAAVPAISTPDLSRSHFQAQDCLERGGAGATGVGAGWLDRVLQKSGAGTTFRGVSSGYRLPRSMAGASNSVVVPSLQGMGLPVGPDWLAPTGTALRALYTGLDHPLAVQTGIALDASAAATALGRTEKKATERGYPAGGFGEDLATLATLIKSDDPAVQVRVATVDVGGWDMHTRLSTDMGRLLKDVADSLGAFFKDLGTAAAARTTVVVMSEFGRRMEQNDSDGTDHGHGGVALVMGGGVAGGVRGQWNGLGPDQLDQGDVPGTNDYRNLLGEVVRKRVGLSDAAIAEVFPGFPVNGTSLGVMA